MGTDDTPIGRILTRREILALLGGTALAACAAPTAAPPSPTAQTPAATAAVRPSAGASGAVAAVTPQCVVVPALTEGPYFVDEKLQRSDIRADSSGGTPRPGAQLDLTVVVGRAAASACAPLQGATVDVWHCDALGVYSDASDPGFNTKGQDWLRGLQTTDATGTVRFTTIYPGWYQGRAVHIHFKIRTAATGGTADFTSQLFFPETWTTPCSRRRPTRRREPVACGTTRTGSTGRAAGRRC